MSTGWLRSFVRAVLVSMLLMAALAIPAAAQESPEPPVSPSPAAEGGICAPWHKCMAYGGAAIALLTLGALGVGYWVQSKGFDKVEHRMGQPHGVPVKKE